MFFYIKEWPNKTATLMTEGGAVLWTFHSAEEALQVCRDWYQVHEENVEYYVDGIDADEINEGGINLDPSCATCAVA